MVPYGRNSTAPSSRVTLPDGTIIKKPIVFSSSEDQRDVFSTALPTGWRLPGQDFGRQHLQLSFYWGSFTLSVLRIAGLIDTANANRGLWPAGVANSDNGLTSEGMELHGRQDTDTDSYTFVGPPPSRWIITKDRKNEKLVHSSPDSRTGPTHNGHTFSGAHPIQDTNSPAADAVRAHRDRRVPAASQPSTITRMAGLMCSISSMRSRTWAY